MNEITIEGDIVPQRWADWAEPDTVVSSRMVARMLAEIDGDVTVYVNSMGGNPVEGEAIRAMLAAHDGEVTAVVRGAAASAASLLIMGADRIEMTEGSWILIHDPSTCMCGNAAEFRASADDLDSVADIYAAVYARRADMSVQEARAIMQAETRYSPEDAIAAGFCDAVHAAEVDGADAPVEAATAEMAMQEFARMEGRVMALAMKAGVAPPAAEEDEEVSGAEAETTDSAATGAAGDDDAENGETPSDPATPDPTATGDAGEAGEAGGTPAASGAAPDLAAAPPSGLQMAARHARAVEALVMGMGGTDRDALRHVTSGRPLEAVANDLYTQLQQETQIMAANPGGQRAHVTRDERTTMRQGMELAMAHQIGRVGEVDGNARRFMDMTIVDMAAQAAGYDGPLRSAADRQEALRMAFHATSDFPEIFGNSVNRILLERYEAAAPTFTILSRQRNFADFREVSMVRAGDFPKLEEVSEGGKIQFGTVGEGAEKVALKSYGVGLMLSRQMLINDDLGAIDEIIANVGTTIRLDQEELFYSLAFEQTLADGNALYHAASHDNYTSSGTKPSVASLGVGRAMMQKQTSIDGRKLNLMPTYIVSGPDKATEVEQLVAPVNAAEAGKVNPFSGRLQPVSTPHITGNAWYLIAGGTNSPYVHGYLDGVEAPRVRIEEPFGSQGVGMTAELDFAVGAVDYRGGYKNAGA